MRTLTLMLLGAALHPAAAWCQPAQRPPTTRGDVTASIGTFSEDHSDLDRYTGWTHSLFEGVSGGFYWTDHLKTEADVVWPRQRDVAAYVPVGFAGSYAYEEHYFRSIHVSIGQLYQAGRNSFFHPFAGAGVNLDRTEHEIERTVHTRTTVTESDRTKTRVRARPFATTGFKAYVSSNTFFRGELKLVFDSSVRQAIWKAGFGIDF